MKRKLTISGIATIIVFLIMRFQGASLKTEISPKAIIDLEFAKTTQRLRELLLQWDVSVVKMNIWIDFVFIVTYVLFISTLSEYAANRCTIQGFNKMGIWLARAAYLAGIFDIAENLLMLQSVAGDFTGSSLLLTSFCAIVKFSILGIILFYVFLSLFSNPQNKTK